MNSTERKSLIGLALLYVFRMLGLFMVLPVMMSFGADLTGATPYLLGIALGIYGLTQAFFQIPLGWLSDRIGRKQVISAGLLIFALGSLLAGLSDNVYLVIAGRALQGAGAIASATLALLTDLTREEHRTKALAVVGMSIGLSFTLAMIIGPALASSFGLSGLFYSVAGLAMLGLGILWFLVPTPATETSNRENRFIGTDVASLLRKPQLMLLNLGIFSLHLVLMAVFIVIPLSLIDAQLDADRHGWFYLPVMLIAFVLMMPLLRSAEKKGKVIAAFQFSILLMILVQLSLMFIAPATVWGLAIAVIGFFAAFNYLEASMPSWLSKIAPAGLKGTAMGVFSTSQFIGAALGGILGGLVFQEFGSVGTYSLTTAVLVIWLIFSRALKAPQALTTITLKTPKVVDKSDEDSWIASLKEQLLNLDGVDQVTIVAEEEAAYLKVNPSKVDKKELEKLVALATV